MTVCNRADKSPAGPAPPPPVTLLEMMTGYWVSPSGSELCNRLFVWPAPEATC